MVSPGFIVNCIHEFSHIPIWNWCQDSEESIQPESLYTAHLLDIMEREARGIMNEKN